MLRLLKDFLILIFLLFKIFILFCYLKILNTFGPGLKKLPPIFSGNNSVNKRGGREGGYKKGEKLLFLGNFLLLHINNDFELISFFPFIHYAYEALRSVVVDYRNLLYVFAARDLRGLGFGSCRFSLVIANGIANGLAISCEAE